MTSPASALAPATLLLVLAALPALAADPALKLHQGDIFTDPVGSVMQVSITNGTAATIGSAVVTCAFTAKGKAAGSASTTIFNIVAGAKGEDQVHLMGASADAASCTITATTPATN
ncbi:hypothetical protein [Ancylobacter radicis]|nr:hypothetical protein [Ancylobacter radicis]